MGASAQAFRNFRHRIALFADLQLPRPLERAAEVPFAHLGFPVSNLRNGASTVLGAIHVECILFDAYGERFRPSPYIQRLVDSGLLGRKTNRGFYTYETKDR